MKLGSDAWNRMRWYYDQLRLDSDGDRVEQYGIREYDLAHDWQNYEVFWKYHIAPASQRPASIFTRPAADDVVSLIAQRSYSVFSSVVEALDEIKTIAANGLGARNRRADIALSFAGRALVMLSELERLISGPPNRFTSSVGCLADKLGLDFALISKAEKDGWTPLRENVVVYRHYITHSGVLFTVTRTGTTESMVVRRELLEGLDPVSWKKCEQEHMGHPDRWVNLSDACKQTVRDTITLLDMAYKSLADEVQPLLANDSYQALWGWYDRMAEIPNPPPRPATEAESSPSPSTPNLSATESLNPASNVQVAHTETVGPRSTAPPEIPGSGNRTV